MIHGIFTRFAPAAALALCTLSSGCTGEMRMTTGSDGVPLAELDRSGAVPDELVLAGPDRVTVIDGAALDIAVSGDQAAAEALRFSLDDGTLVISRDNDADGDIGTAVVRVTLPRLDALVLAGSGSVDAASLGGDASVTIAGSGTARVRKVAVQTLDLTIAGTGEFAGAGTIDTLDLTVAGSGSGRMAAIRVGQADVSIVGSGSAEFASDGKVDASIMGSGTVTVTGKAQCTSSKMGSGQLVCRGGTAAAEPAATTPSAAPSATPMVAD